MPEPSIARPTVQRSGEPDEYDVENTVFVSHSSEDLTWVESKLLPCLAECGLKPWLSKVDIRTSDYWERELVAALKRCNWFLVVLSPRSAKSEWVKDELHWAITNKQNKIILILIQKCDLT
jgi:hypothetical protein